MRKNLGIKPNEPFKPTDVNGGKTLTKETVFHITLHSKPTPAQRFIKEIFTIIGLPGSPSSKHPQLLVALIQLILDNGIVDKPGIEVIIKQTGKNNVKNYAWISKKYNYG